MGEAVNAGIVLAAAFVPALAYLWKVRSSERLGMREAWSVLLLTFAYGAGAAVLVAGALNPLVGSALSAVLPRFPAQFVLVVIAAPLVEEAVKACGVTLAGPHLKRPVDGIVYGASSALGFSATENLVYQTSALAEGGTLAWFAVVVARSVSSSLMHPSATGITGYGVARARLRGATWLAVMPFYALAVAAHAGYNYVAAFLPPVDLAGLSFNVNFLAAVLVAGLSFRLLRAWVRAG